MKDKHDKVTLSFPEMEGDYIYSKEGDARLYDAADKLKVFEEMDIHFTVRKFEDLLHIHGLDHLLGQMTTKGAHALLMAAHKHIHDGDGGYE